MFYFLTLLILIFGIVCYLVGTETISKEVRTNWSPQDIEMLQEQLANQKQVGQLLLLIFSFILIYNIT